MLFSRQGSRISLSMDDISGKMEEVSEKSKQIFHQLQGRVFHTIKNIGGQNYMNKYRIGADGKFTLEESLLGSFLGTREVQDIIKKAGNEVKKAGNEVRYEYSCNRYTMIHLILRLEHV